MDTHNSSRILELDCNALWLAVDCPYNVYFPDMERTIHSASKPTRITPVALVKSTRAHGTDISKLPPSGTELF